MSWAIPLSRPCGSVASYYACQRFFPFLSCFEGAHQPFLVHKAISANLHPGSGASISRSFHWCNSVKIDIDRSHFILDLTGYAGQDVLHLFAGQAMQSYKRPAAYAQLSVGLSSYLYLQWITLFTRSKKCLSLNSPSSSLSSLLRLSFPMLPLSRSASLARTAMLRLMKSAAVSDLFIYPLFHAGSSMS